MNCFKTIDLTAVDKKRVYHPPRLLRLFDGDDYFKVRCPYCEKLSPYQYSEVKPMPPLDWQRQEAEILALKAENLKLKHDALTIMRDVAVAHGTPEPLKTDAKAVNKKDPKEAPYT
jgi:hypothetical protein